MDLAPLRHALESLSPLSDAAWAPVPAWVSERRVDAGDTLLRAGETATEVFFVREGLLREFYVDTRGRESTRRFTPAPELSGSLADLLSGGPARVWVEALEPSCVWCIPWAKLDALSQRDPQWMRAARVLAERLYQRKMQREFELLTLPAAERYRRFAEEQPALDARLPRHLVASYIGVTPVHLSRLRAARPAPPAPAARTGRTRSA
jgi:CRP-like cAMP-binding protein